MFSFVAAINGQFEITKYLVKKGANVEHRDCDGFTAVHYGFFK